MIVLLRRIPTQTASRQSASLLPRTGNLRSSNYTLFYIARENFQSRWEHAPCERCEVVSSCTLICAEHFRSKKKGPHETSPPNMGTTLHRLLPIANLKATSSNFDARRKLLRLRRLVGKEIYVLCNSSTTVTFLTRSGKSLTLPQRRVLVNDLSPWPPATPWT